VLQLRRMSLAWRRPSLLAFDGPGFEYDFKHYTALHWRIKVGRQRTGHPVLAGGQCTGVLSSVFTEIRRRQAVVVTYNTAHGAASPSEVLSQR
jgi:hypothetical protein